MQSFILQDKSEQYWLPEENRQLNEDEVRELKEIYWEIYRGNNNRESAEEYKDMWQDVLGEGELGPQGLTGGLETLALADGSLDLSAAKQVALADIARAENTLETQRVTKHGRKCFFFICTAYIRGQMGSSPGKFNFAAPQATQGGGTQSASTYGYSSFSYPVCVTNAKTTQSLIGCAPSSFMGLVGRQFDKGQTIAGYNKSRYSRNDLFKYMTRPSSSRYGQPLIANYMKTCWLNDGGLTKGRNFINGGNRFFANTKTDLTVQGTVTEYAGNVAAGNAYAEIMSNQIGVAENPVVVEYFRGVGKGHFAPVAKYWIRQRGVTYVDVQTTDHYGRWYSLTGGWGTQRGAFYLKHYKR